MNDCKALSSVDWILYAESRGDNGDDRLEMEEVGWVILALLVQVPTFVRGGDGDGDGDLEGGVGEEEGVGDGGLKVDGNGDEGNEDDRGASEVGAVVIGVKGVGVGAGVRVGVVGVVGEDEFKLEELEGEVGLDKVPIRLFLPFPLLLPDPLPPPPLTVEGVDEGSKNEGSTASLGRVSINMSCIKSTYSGWWKEEKCRDRCSESFASSLGPYTPVGMEIDMEMGIMLAEVGINKFSGIFLGSLELRINVSA